MTTLIRDPLLHFLALGAALFAVLAWLEDAEEEERERIVIGAEQVEELRRAAAFLRGREPTRAELEELLEPVIREQVLYREARALGLDRNDETVRLRLVEKMQFLTQDLVEPEPPADEDLAAFFAADPGRFEVPASVTFEQVFFNPRDRGDAAAADAQAALAALREGTAEQELGDRSPLQARYDDATRERVEILFGAPLAQALFTTPPGRWEGPFESDFGLHVVRLVERKEAYQPTLEEARPRVLEAWLADRRREANEAEYRRMRARYEVVVARPDGLEPVNPP